MTVDSSGINSVLLPERCTAHLRFVILLGINEDLTCNVKQGTPQVELLRKTDLIIWDEVLIVHKFCFETLNKTLKDILQLDNPNSHNLPFGAKTMVVDGNFRQILPIIPKGNCSDIVHVTLNSSYLWNHCQV